MYFLPINTDNPTQMASTEPQSPAAQSISPEGTTGSLSPIDPAKGLLGSNTPASDPIFPPNPPPQGSPCSYNECRQGHKWPATLALARCPGCTGGVVAVQKTNCPFCNEPIVRTILRSDFLPGGSGIAARCQNHIPPGADSLDIEMVRGSWKTAEAEYKDFTTREAEERAREVQP